MKSIKYICVVIYLLTKTILADMDEPCGCFMLGTFGNIEGESLCNSNTLQCKCYPNVIGKNCDKCKEGYYNILSGRGCLKCNCSPFGSVNGTCEMYTGQCLCKSGFTGFRCDKCVTNSFQSFGKCISCNCNIYGSKDFQCSSEGQCRCINNAEGAQCNHCKENTYMIEKGCLPCPKCYKLVQNASNEYSKALEIFMKLLNATDNISPSHEKHHRSFLEELNLLTNNITQLKHRCEENANTKLPLDELYSLYNETQLFYITLSKITDEISSIDFKDINTALHKVRQNLKLANAIISQCEEALKNATTVSKNLVRHTKTMSELAKDSIAKTNNIQNIVDGLISISTIVNETCKEACESVEEFHKNQNQLDTELMNFRAQLTNTTMGANIMQNYILDFHIKTKVNKDEAIQLHNQSQNIEIPLINNITGQLEEFDDDYILINKTLFSINQMDKELNRKQQLISDTCDKLNPKQTIIDNTLATLQKADMHASDSVNNINNILKMAKEGLDNLNDGYTHIKEEVQMHLKEVPLIQGKIKAVVDYAEPIELIFVEVFVLIDSIEEMRVNATRILKSIEQNYNITETHMKEVEDLEKKQLDLSNHLEESHKKIKKLGENLDNYKKYNNQIQLKIQDIQEYIIYLSVFPTTDEELDEIENEISYLEEMFWVVDEYKSEKSDLEQAVQHVKDILESLPTEDLCESAKSEPKTST